MALPRSPRGTYTKTIDLNIDDIRTFNSSTYNNQHLLIIPKTTIDTSRALVFWNCASVTIIGGHFRPGVNGWGFNAESGTGSKSPSTLNFANCGAVYLEGVITDNINLYVDNPDTGENGGDALFVSGKNALTDITVQNCAFINVRGTQTPAEAHGDIFQTGSTTQGKAGNVFFYNFTGSGDYQGFFMDPQTAPAGADYPNGGMVSLTLQRVNLKRTAQKTLKHQLLFFFSSESAYDNRGYPVTMTDVWLDGLPGDTLEDLVWPRNGAASNGQFTNVKYQATFDTDATGRYAEWRGLTNSGKVFSGKAYEGSPPTGDYCPTTSIGLGYVQGTEIGGGTAPVVTYRSTAEKRVVASGTTTYVDIQRTLPGTSILDNIALTPIPHGTWTGEGSGTLTVNSPTAVDLVTEGAGPKTARLSYATQPGQNYALSFTMAGQAAIVSAGTNPLANNLNGGVTAPLGASTGSFTALTTITYVKFSTTTPGTMFISGLAIDETIWATGGPGTVTGMSDTAVTINGVGGSPTYARRVLNTTPGLTYTVTWTSSSATGTWGIGTSLEGDEIAGPGPSFVVGANTATFVATEALTYFRFQRTAAGTVALTNFSSDVTTVTAWTGGGAGTTSIASDTSVTLNAVGTLPTYARRVFATQGGRKYSFAHSWAGNAGNLKIGTTSGGGELLPTANAIVGANSLEFVSDNTLTYVEIARTPAGSATVTGLGLTELSAHAWYTGGTGTTAVTDNATMSLAGNGSSTTFLIRPIATVKDREYIWTFTASGGTPGRMVGSTFGNTDLAPLANSAAGANSVKFAAISHQSWLRIQQVAASGTIAITNSTYALVPFENAANWTIVGTGTTSISAVQTVTINGNGTTATAARRTYNTIVGKAYELLFNVTGGATQYQVGSTDGGAQVVASTLVQPGTISVKFVATSALTHFHVQRVSTGSCVVTRPVMSLTTIANTVSATITSYNADNIGGIGKPYWYVDRLSDSATDGANNRGSLRYCLTNGTGADRLILSEIQGVSTPTSAIGIGTGRNNITLAFYTGPGPFVLQGGLGTFSIRGQNNVVEHLMVERKYTDAGAVNGDGMQIISTGQNTHHILVRNCFTSYSQDEAFQIFRSRNEAALDRADDISLHWNIFTNPLKDPREFNPNFLSNTNVDDFANGQDGDHNFNVLVGGYSTRIDLQRNFMGNGKQRNPRMCAPLTNVLIANNVSFNYGYGGIGFQSDADDWQQTNNPPGSLRYAVSIIGNIGIPGPNSSRVELISQHGGPKLGGDAIIHIANNSIIQGLNAAVVGTANTIGSQAGHLSQFPGINPNRQDTLLSVLAIAQAQLMTEMNLNAGPFPKLRAADPTLMLGPTHAIKQMNNEVEGKWINHESEGPGFSNPPTVVRPLTGNLAPPSDPTNVPQVQAWLRERRLEVAYD